MIGALGARRVSCENQACGGVVRATPVRSRLPRPGRSPHWALPRTTSRTRVEQRRRSGLSFNAHLDARSVRPTQQTSLPGAAAPTRTHRPRARQRRLGERRCAPPGTLRDGNAHHPRRTPSHRPLERQAALRVQRGRSALTSEPRPLRRRRARLSTGESTSPALSRNSATIPRVDSAARPRPKESDITSTFRRLRRARNKSASAAGALSF